MTRSGKIIDLRKRASARQRVLPRISRVPEDYKRPAPLRARRRKMRATAALIMFLFVAVLALGIIWASYLPQLTIRSIEVVGAKQVPSERIGQYVDTILDNGSRQVFSRRNIFVYPRASLEKAVQGYFPRIRLAKISRSALFATAVIVHVEEREPYALWCAPVQVHETQEGEEAAQCYTLDIGGFIFAEHSPQDDAPPEMPYIFLGGISSSDNPIGQRFAPAHLASLIVLLDLAGQAGFLPLEVSIEDERDFFITFGEGFMLKVSFGQDANTLMKNLQLVLSSETLKGKEKKLQYIDLRFDNRVYYKLKS